MIYKIFGALVALVAIVALMSTPGQAADTAGKGAGVIGITAGALVGSIPNMIKGFNRAREAGAPVDNQPARLNRDGRGNRGGGGGRANS